MHNNLELYCEVLELVTAISSRIKVFSSLQWSSCASTHSS